MLVRGLIELVKGRELDLLSRTWKLLIIPSYKYDVLEVIAEQ